MSEIEIVEQGEVDEVVEDLTPDGGEGYYNPANEGDGAAEVEPEFVDPVAVQIALAEREFADRPEEPEAADEPTPEEDTILTPAVKQAMASLFSIQDRLEAAVEDHAEKAEVAKTAKKRVESLQEDLQYATRKLREARTANEPDPEKYPLLDGKAEVNARFSKPEAIQPTEPETFDEFARRRAVAQRFDDLGLSPKIVEVLDDLGLVTIDKFRIKSDALAEANASLTTLSGMTEKRLEKVAEAIERFYKTCGEEWAALHPEAEVEGVNTPESVDPAEEAETFEA